MAACDICCDKYTPVLRKSVECLYCQYHACLICVKTYLLNSTEDAHCMKCRHAWNREFIDMHLSKTFRNTKYKEHRENVLFEREKALLPQTQQLLEQRDREAAIRNEIYQFRKNNSRLHGQIFNLLGERQRLRRETPPNPEALKQNKEERTRLQNEINENHQSIAALEEKFTVKERKEFIRACPASDCRGFLSTQWMCGLCHVKVCSKCHEIKTDQETHVCDENNVLSAQLLAKDTKPCPKCAAQIHKLSGCAQMWCTQCHTAFDWNSGNIEKKIHNPHYYEWMRRQNGNMAREPGDILCGGLPDLYDLQISLGEMSQVHYDRLYHMHRLVNHVEHAMARQFRPFHHDTTYLRIGYLRKTIDELELKRKLQQYEKKESKMRDISAVLDMFVNTAAQMFRDLPETRDMESFEKVFSELREYANQALSVIEHRYNTYAPRIVF